MAKLKFVNKNQELKPMMTVKQSKVHSRGSKYLKLLIISGIINIISISYIILTTVR